MTPVKALAPRAKTLAPQTEDMLGGMEEKLRLFRPRFVYVLVRIGSFPIPIGLIAPLSLLQLAPLIARYVIRKNATSDAETQFVLQALEGFGGQIAELRKMSGFTLVEVRVKGNRTAEMKMGQGSLGEVFVKVGIL